MVAVVNHLHLNIPVDDLVSKVQSEGFPLLAEYPGFRGAYLVKAAADRCIVILLWETQADAESGARQFGPGWFKDNIAVHLASEQQRSAGPVVAHA
jgi:heme-degrading monooxygenase HmoA